LTRPTVILGLQPAGLALARSLGRCGVHLTGIALERADFGLRSRYVQERVLIEYGDPAAVDRAVLDALHRAAEGGPLVVVPERDAHVELLLRRWDEVRAIAAIPLPSAPAVTASLRDKALLPETAASAGLAVPRTAPFRGPGVPGEFDLPYPFLLKPFDSERYAAVFSEKVVVVGDAEEARAAQKRGEDAGFRLFAQELIPGSTDRIQSLFTYIGSAGEPLGSVVGRKVRQGPPGFGASTIFASEHDEEVLDAGLRLLRSVDYRGFAHVEVVRDPRDGALKLLEVNTRLPVWAGVGLSRFYDLGPVAYADLCGNETRALPPFTQRVTWTYLAKDAVTVAREAFRGRLDPRAVIRPYGQPHVPAVRAARDYGPALALVRWAVARAVTKLTAGRGVS
jgi:D-aspartate ligase